MHPTQWRDQGQFFSAGSQSLFFTEAGQGAPLLLLHAYPTASWGFHKLWPTLTQHYRVITLDLLGSGFSDKPRGSHYSIFQLADSVETLLAARGIQQFHILAHAYGVTTAQELLARQQDPSPARYRILSICFVNGGLFPEATRPTPTQKLLLTPIGASIVRLTPYPYTVFCDKLARNFGPKTQPSSSDLEAIWHLLTHHDGHRVVPDVLQYLKQRHQQRERWVGALQQTAIPLCLVNGAADPVSGQEIPKRWQTLLPQHTLIQLDPQIGHYPPLEDPEGVLQAFSHFQQWAATAGGSSR